MTLPTRALGRSGLEITVLGSDQNRDADEVPQILGRLALGEAINNYETVRQTVNMRIFQASPSRT